MTCLALVPFLTAVFVMLVTVVVALRNKVHAQSVCVQRTSKLTEELGQRLGDLLHLNPRARRLRQSRRAAERALQVAKVAKFLPGIVGAEAWLRGTQIAQMFLAMRQREIMAEAALARLRYRRLLTADVRPLGGRDVRLGPLTAQALAVRPRPPNEIAPEYVPVAGFARRQAQSVRFESELAPALGWLGVRRHRTECVITLERKDHAWHSRILAASAPSSWPSWR